MNCKTLFAAAALLCLALSTGCSSAPKKEAAAPAPAAKPGCSSDGECAAAGPCHKCVAGACKASFGPECCDSDADCGNPALRCRANKCK